jgi:Zn2+/Cd2+-exporting ATPase
VLVVACPCAFILASPTAMVAALSAAARLGILIKNVGDIELAARINAFVFDKTGTLTTGPRRQPPRALRRPNRPNCSAWPPPPNATAIIPPPGPSANSPPKPASRSPSRRTSPRRPDAAFRREVDGAEITIGRAQWLRDNEVAGDFTASVDLNETEGSA